jgi:Bacterial TSP3 repeat
MHRVGTHQKRRTAAYILCGLLLLLADLLLVVQMAAAAPAYTPYANAVAGQTGLAVGTAANAVGAPDGQATSFAGLNAGITLDMGDGEEGTNALKVYFGQINVQSTVLVEFLDDDQIVITQEERSLFLDFNTSSQTFAYDWHGPAKAYRFVRVSSLAGLGFGIDAVEALGFIGSSPTQDTDGDGIPDREDGGPLIFNPPATNNNGNGGSGGGGGGGNNNSGGGTNTVIRTVTTSTNSGVSTPVNNPPAPANDKDGDQMDDAWEAAHKLDPNNKNDASGDPDGDGLINLREYQFDADPFKRDTDGDGMPDGWEVDSGLNAKTDDAVQDPDADYLTNLGEYHFNTNPYRADDFRKLAAKLDGNKDWWYWIIFVILLALATASFLRAIRSSRHEGKKHKKK